MNPRTEQYELYWDEGGNTYQLFKKGKLKRIYRKKFYRNYFKHEESYPRQVKSLEE